MLREVPPGATMVGVPARQVGPQPAATERCFPAYGVEPGVTIDPVSRAIDRLTQEFEELACASRSSSNRPSRPRSPSERAPGRRFLSVLSLRVGEAGTVMHNSSYLDYNATAPVRPAVAEAMRAVLAQTGNPSSVHRFGREARRALEGARAAVAALVGAAPDQVVFTSGGTEANNQALRSARGAVAVSAIEHVSVLAAAPDAVRIAVDAEGASSCRRSSASWRAGRRTWSPSCSPTTRPA